MIVGKFKIKQVSCLKSLLILIYNILYVLSLSIRLRGICMVQNEFIMLINLGMFILIYILYQDTLLDLNIKLNNLSM